MAQWPDGPGVVTFPDGRRVRGRGLRRLPPAGPAPEFAVYLGRDRPEATGWQHRWIEWRDFRTPSSTGVALDVLREAHERAAHERVEIACPGGVGRTGTALAAVAVLAGIAPSEAVAWVRRHYHHRAVETPWQRRWVARLPSSQAAVSPDSSLTDRPVRTSTSESGDSGTDRSE